MRLSLRCAALYTEDTTAALLTALTLYVYMDARDMAGVWRRHDGR